jgi:torulene dioxygenase
MDVATYPDAAIIDASFESARMYDEEYVKPASYTKVGTRVGDDNVPTAQLRRYKLSDIPAAPLNTSRRAEYEVLGLDIDLPRFDPRCKNKPYHFLYGTCPNQNKSTLKGSGEIVFDSVQKMDLDRPATSTSSTLEQIGTSASIDKRYGSGPNTWRFDPLSASCSEPIFLPNPSGSEEDDGVV